MLRPLTATLALAFTGAALPAILGDYETVPPDPATTHAQLSAGKARLGPAIQAAEEATGGIVTSASLDPATGVASLEVYTADTHWSVDVENGELGTPVKIPRFPGDAASGDMVTLPSGLMYYDLVEGGGESPPDSKARVKVHYTIFDPAGKTVAGGAAYSTYAGTEKGIEPLIRTEFPKVAAQIAAELVKLAPEVTSPAAPVPTKTQPNKRKAKANSADDDF